MTTKSRLRKEGGFLISLELVFVATLMLCAVIGGWAAFGGSITGEMGDLGRAAKGLNQSYAFPGYQFNHDDGAGGVVPVGGWAVSKYQDLTSSQCDISIDIVTPAPAIDLQRP